MPHQFDRITVNPDVMNGQPCIRGIRLTVRRVIQAMALYPNRQELLAEYPELEEADIVQALGAVVQPLQRPQGASPLLDHTAAVVAPSR